MRPAALPPSRWDFDPASWPEDDCVAAGADLEPPTIIDAYQRGAFPMPHEDLLLWWSPLRRGILLPGDLRISRSLTRSMRRFQTSVDQSFVEVVDACADPRRSGAWIDERMRDAYVQLHHLGWAHSVETRDTGGRLVGGLYGLAVGGLFAGESMFHHETDASKVALVELSRRWGDGLIDTQWSTPHLTSLGVTEVDRAAYLATIKTLVHQPPRDAW
ncbi:MAG: leucyl/phenylalanyl-tRNA--protein transferase [Aeromicrobium sp.]